MCRTSRLDFVVKVSFHIDTYVPVEDEGRSITLYRNRIFITTFVIKHLYTHYCLPGKSILNLQALV